MTFTELKILKQDTRQKISIVADIEDGKQYIKREIYSDKRDIYKTLLKIRHKSIPHIYAVEFEDSTVVIEEYIVGQTLSELMQEGQWFTKRQIDAIANQIVSALLELHKAQIIHRDIKPDNIIVDKSGHAWLIDYEIARFYRSEIRKDTETLGTVGYAPPEQFGMMPTDYKTDIYAFGATLIQLLEYSKIKGSLYRVAEKCKRLDPMQRYESMDKLKSALDRRWLRNPLVILLTLILLLTIGGIIFWNRFEYQTSTNNSENQISQEDTDNQTASGDVEKQRRGGYVDLDEEAENALRFFDFKASRTPKIYSEYENYDSVTIFGVDALIHHLTILEDIETWGKIALGRRSQTEVDANIELNNGVLTVSLSDPYGHSFEKQFEYTNNHEDEVLYAENRRQNADMICWDMDGDQVEELLIGINDASFTVDEGRILSYMNYAQAWCIKYNEASGFTLCDNDMFSAGSKFALLEGDLRVYLSAWSASADPVMGYTLKGNTIVPFE